MRCTRCACCAAPSSSGQLCSCDCGGDVVGSGWQQRVAGSAVQWRVLLAGLRPLPLTHRSACTQRSRREECHPALLPSAAPQASTSWSARRAGCCSTWTRRPALTPPTCRWAEAGWSEEPRGPGRRCGLTNFGAGVARGGSGTCGRWWHRGLGGGALRRGGANPRVRGRYVAHWPGHKNRGAQYIQMYIASPFR